MNRKYMIYIIIIFIILLIASLFFINNNSGRKNEIEMNIFENEVVNNIVENNIEQNIKYKILGTYNAERPYGTEAFTYIFSENSVIYAFDAYNDGAYEIDGDNIRITYSITHSPVNGSPMDFVRQPEELRIEDENTLVNSSGTKFYKTSDKTKLE